jgi:hypothetical protein
MVYKRSEEMAKTKQQKNVKKQMCDLRRRPRPVAVSG